MFCLGLKTKRLRAQTLEKDTVTTDEEDDEVNAHHHVGEDGTSVRHDAVVHHSVPVLSSEDLRGKTIRGRHRRQTE